MFKKSKDKYSNTFYRESQSVSDSGNSKFISFIKRNWKKIFRWSFYLFMIITTLWGCVNGFMIRTNPKISSGLEFFLNYDQTIPNLYMGEKDVIYQVSIDEDEKNESGEVTGQKRVLEELPFRSYGQLVADEGGNVSQGYDYISNLTNNYTFSHQVSMINASVFNTLVTKDQSENGALYLNGEVPNYVENDSTKVSLDWKLKYGDACYYTDTDNQDTYGDEIIIPGCFVVSDSLNPLASGEEFIVVDSLDISQDSNGVYNSVLDHSKYLLNIHALYNGGKASSGKGLTNPNPSDNPEVLFITTKDKDSGEIIEEESIYEWARDLIDLENENGETILTDEEYELIGDYNPDFVVFNEDNYDVSNPNNIFIENGISNDPYWTVDEFNSKNVELEFGSSIFIGNLPASGIYSPSQQAIDVGISRRQDNWYDLDTNKQAGDDPTIANSGWVVTDPNGDLFEFYDDNGNVDYLATAQRALEFGYFNTENIQSEGTRYSVMSELVETFKDEERYMEVDRPEFIFSDYYSDNIPNAPPDNNTEYTIVNNYEIDFGGFSNFNEKNVGGVNVVPQEDQMGMNAMMADSLRAVGLNPENHERIAMVSWGQAWKFGPFYGMFIWPLSKISLGIQSVFPASMGIWGILIGVFVVVFGLRLLSWLVSFKSNKNQFKMQEIQTQVARINAKYEKYKGNKQMKQRKQLEVMALYRKNNVNPLASMGGMFLTMPIFLSIWTIINGTVVYKLATLGPILFNQSVFSGLFSIGGGGLYVLFSILIVATQYIQTKIPTWLSQKRQGLRFIDDKTKKQIKKSGKTQTIMLVIFTIMGFTVPLLLAIYWIYSGLFTILQNFIQHSIIQGKQRKKIKQE